MAIVLTQQTVFNEFTTVIPAEVQQVLIPHIVGPQAELHRYTNPTEKPEINVGPYNPNMATFYTWPDKLSTSLVDLDYFKLFFDAALLRYFQKLNGVGSTVTAVNNFLNRIIISGSNGFKANGVSYPRLAALFDRDVQIGDVVKLNLSSTTYYSTVTNLIADVIAPVTGSATSDANNDPTQGSSSNTTQTAGTMNDVAASENAASYNGLATGDINETYIITVTQGSTGGNATTALITVQSASGRDNQATPFAPAAFASPTNIGTRGLTVTWTHTVDDLIVGQQWTVVVSQAFTAPVPTSSGTYTGTVSTTYIITVSLGGNYTDPTKPQITVINDLGTDSSGPTTVPGTATNVAVGTLGIQVQFSQAALRKGDKYYIPITGPASGAYRTIQLANNLPATLISAGDMTLELSIQKNLQIPQQRVSSPPLLNWTIDQTGVTINSGIDGYDPSLTNLGALFSVPVVSGPSTAVYIHYRAWMTQWNNFVGNAVQANITVNPTTVITPLLGTVDPDNPLAYAVLKAMLNSNGQPISFSSILDPTSIPDWTNGVAVLVGLPIASVTILSHDPNVMALFKTHVDQESQSQVGRWRNLWFTPAVTSSIAIVDQATTTDGNVALATVAANPAAPTTQYTYLVCTTGNAKFITKNVMPGDIVRYLYSIDGFGDSTWSEYVVSQVVNEDTLVLVPPGTGIAIATPQRVEVWRNLSATAIANNLVSQSNAVVDKYVRFTWPDVAEDTTGTIDGYFMAAAFAGFTAGVAPHQGVQGIPLAGFTGVSRSIMFFGNAQLNILAAGGFFVVTQDSSGNIFARNSLTTDQSSAENGQEVVVRNDNAISQVLYNRVAQFFDVANITDAGIILVRSELQGGIQVLAGQTFINRLGDMITDATVTDIRPSVIEPDQLVVQMTVDRPFPIESLDLTLVFTQS